LPPFFQLTVKTFRCGRGYICARDAHVMRSALFYGTCFYCRYNEFVANSEKVAVGDFILAVNQHDIRGWTVERAQAQLHSANTTMLSVLSGQPAAERGKRPSRDSVWAQEEMTKIVYGDPASPTSPVPPATASELATASVTSPSTDTSTTDSPTPATTRTVTLDRTGGQKHTFTPNRARSHRIVPTFASDRAHLYPAILVCLARFELGKV
jgi:hypothetical protein